jgi:hypothetical protein
MMSPELELDLLDFLPERSPRQRAKSIGDQRSFGRFISRQLAQTAQHQPDSRHSARKVQQPIPWVVRNVAHRLPLLPDLRRIARNPSTRREKLKN